MADRAMADDLSTADETADAVINRARATADALLAAARKKADREATGEHPSDTLKTSRAAEDRLLLRERVASDQILREERAGHTALLQHERDGTDEDLSHERARSDHALAARDEFMGVISHDLLNILNAVMGFAALIEREVSQDVHVERVVTHARRIQRSGGRMRRLVGDLVDVASIEAGMLTVTRAVGNVADVVTETLETFQAQASGSGMSLAAEIVSPLPPIAFDPARLLQVLCNLVSNAIKFSAAPGTVIVGVEHVDSSIVFRIRDTGEGIPAGKLEAIFDRFVQLEPNDRRGVGLGLYISKCIVHGHGGRIWAESTIGTGTTICFTLPVEAGPVASSSPDALLRNRSDR